MRKVLPAVAAAGLIALATAGCGASWNAAHNHNAPTATNDAKSKPVWHWLDSPGSFQTIIYACEGTEGYYETQDNQYPIVIVPQDPMCGFQGPVTLRTAR